MKKIIVFLGILAATVMIIAAVVFSCNKQEESQIIDGHSVKVQKAMPDCIPPSQIVQLTLSNRSGDCIYLCVDCNSIRNGAIESCFNLCTANNANCQHLPHGTCCPYPLHIQYKGTGNMRDPNNWQWAQDRDGILCHCATNLRILTNGTITPHDLLQIVADPALDLCFR
ncbi:MAG: hypothetical protein LBI60_03355 [Bacteroidales bacterium]|jgi:hypothetical protein|nr:hypothetical protein [Bacteroidales bacterium]